MVAALKNENKKLKEENKSQKERIEQLTQELQEKHEAWGALKQVSVEQQRVINRTSEEITKLGLEKQELKTRFKNVLKQLLANAFQSDSVQSVIDSIKSQLEALD